MVLAVQRQRGNATGRGGGEDVVVSSLTSKQWAMTWQAVGCVTKIWTCMSRFSSHRGGNREEVQFNHVVTWTYLPARDCLDFVSRAVKGEIKVRWLHNAREDIEAVEYNKAPAIQCY